MSKKKINNRLEKLFEDIDKEPEVKQVKGVSRSGQKMSSQKSASDFSSKPASKVPETFSDIDFPTTVERATEQENVRITPSTMLSTAFRTDGNNWATLKVVDEREQRTWGTEEQMLVKQVADQLSLALENARLFQETQLRAEELTVLNDLARKLSSQLNVDQVLQETYKGISKLIDTKNFFVGLYNPERNEIEYPLNITESAVDKEITVVPADQGISGYIFKTKKPLLIKSNLGEWLEAQNMEAVGELAASWLGTPLMVGDDFIGLMAVQDYDLPEAYDEHASDIMSAFASQAAIAIQNARLFEETQRRSEELASLNEIITAANQTLDTKSILEIVINKVLELSGFDGGLITMFNDTRGKLERAIRIGMPGESPEDPAKGIDGSLCDHVYRTGEVLVIQDIVTGMPGGINAQNEVEAGLHGYIGIPIESKGRVLGTLCIFRYKNVPIPGKIVELTHTIGSQLGFTLENARLFDESRKFRLGLERSADAVFMTDIEGTIVYANPSFEKIYGFSLNEVIGQNPRIIKSGTIPQKQYKHFWNTLLNKETVSGEIINKTKDGRLIPVSGTNSPILDEHGNILGFLAIHSDITERKENEESLNRRNEYLAASAEIGRLVTSTLELNTIFDRSVNLVVERFGYYHASIFIIDESGSKAVLKEATGVAGKKLKDRNHSLPVGSKSTVGEATSSGKVVVINDTERNSLHKPNPLLPETKSEAAFPLTIGDRIIGALDIQSTEMNAFTEDDVAILELLTDQIAVGIDNARSYNLAQKAVEEMREVDRLKSQFLANMSHELRTPLNSIIGFARVILKGIDGPITDLQQQDLTAIFNSGQHLLGLINDILDLSRIEAGKMDLTFDEVNVSDLIASVMSTAVGLVKDKPIELRSEIEEGLPLVRADAMRIRQVLINFLSNAAKFSEEGEIVVKAMLDEPAKGQPYVTVSVIDTGPGISKEDQEKLFQPFSQVDASLTRKVGGSGLGLSICHHLIQMHNGLIGVHSTTGKGSTFYFSIPVVQNKPKSDRLEAERVILAIDDDPQIISLYERYLQPKGFHVIGLNNPAKAKERATQLKPFAITLDIMMPGYDGWQVLTDLKLDPETRNIPVIVCSIVEEEEKGFSLGAADYLVKPIIEDDLLASLDRLNGDGSIREVLVIDDDPNDLSLLGKMLTEQGRYKAILAEGGPTGWNIIKSKTPHAIVLDLFMPEMDGFSILEKLRKDAKLRALPVVVVTGADLTAEQQKQLEGIGQRLLQKSSLKEEDLIDLIENALQRVKVK